MSWLRRAWVALAVLALLAPLGLYLPAWMGSGPAWGEWELAEIRALLGYTPAGMAGDAERWRGALPGYALPGETGSAARQGIGYLLSAVLGMAACGAGAWALGRWLSRGKS
ncbi:MAG: PDGLE domain-containing protein [Candidatus Methylomirabilales bacterium]